MPTSRPTSILVAFGGNAILKERERGTAEEQFRNLESALECVADLVQLGHRVIITHGNGPQVGVLMRQNEAASERVPERVGMELCRGHSLGSRRREAPRPVPR